VFPSRLYICYLCPGCFSAFFSGPSFRDSDSAVFISRLNNPDNLVSLHPAVNSSTFSMSRSHKPQSVPSRTHACFRRYPAARFLCLNASCFSLFVSAITAPCLYINMVTDNRQEKNEFFTEFSYIFLIFFISAAFSFIEREGRVKKIRREY
jgi:hypothetical protein